MKPVQCAGVCAAGEADVIDVACPGQQVADNGGLGGAYAAGQPVVTWQLQPNDEIRATSLSQSHHQIGDDAHNPFYRVDISLLI